jgi:hypothetical protein
MSTHTSHLVLQTILNLSHHIQQGNMDAEWYCPAFFTYSLLIGCKPRGLRYEYATGGGAELVSGRRYREVYGDLHELGEQNNCSVGWWVCKLQHLHSLFLPALR